MRIIFTHLKPEIWQYKTALSLRKKGIKTISISLLAFDRILFRNVFDEVINLNLPNLKPKTILKHFIKNPVRFLSFFYNLLAIKADAAICQGAPHYLAAFFIRLFKHRFPTIYFPYDMIASRHKPGYEKLLQPREIHGEKYSFLNCDGFIFKGGEEEISYIPHSFKINLKPRLNFPCYVLSEWNRDYEKKSKLSCKDKEIHIVYAGGYIQKGDDVTLPSKDIAKQIVSQRIHYHVYPSGSSVPEEDIKEITQEGKLRKFFHIHNPVPQNKLSEELSKYDFGSHIVYLTKNIIPESARNQGTNKFSSYLEACMPIIINKDYRFYAEPIEKNNLGISIESIKNLRASIKSKNYKDMIKNIEKFRKTYSIDNNISRLIMFIKSLKRH